MYTPHARIAWRNSRAQSLSGLATRVTGVPSQLGRRIEMTIVDAGMQSLYALTAYSHRHTSAL